ncbi:unnamed protein product [Lactuca virosa]|uniref:Uncharacterized protein n=1 Tax=Lactuca virosa TaxID=75947 RepID=A0AAU9NPV5_9ASTR|nr:unnamed protein product [Lactuca virosa]
MRRTTSQACGVRSPAESTGGFGGLVTVKPCPGRHRRQQHRIITSSSSAPISNHCFPFSATTEAATLGLKGKWKLWLHSATAAATAPTGGIQ